MQGCNQICTGVAAVCALQGGHADRTAGCAQAGDQGRARLLLRLLAALVVPGVLHASAMLATLEGVARSALQIAEAGAQTHLKLGLL